MGRIKGWRKEYENKHTTQWGLIENSSGIGSYLRMSKDSSGHYSLRVWHGNSIGFPHTGGAKGGKTFKSKTRAKKFASTYMRKNTWKNLNYWKRIS